MTWQDRILLAPAVLAGKPVIKGTRIAVEFLLDLLAALHYAAETMKRERVYPLAV